MPESEDRSAARIASHLLDTADPKAVAALIEAHVLPLASTSQDEVVSALRQIFIEKVNEDPDRAQLAVERILTIAEATSRSELRAFGLCRLAQLVVIRDGDYRLALEHYAAAADIYQQAEDLLALARIEVTRVAVLGEVGSLDLAVARSEWAAPILEANEEWKPLASLTYNTAIANMRNHQYEVALGLLKSADVYYDRLGPSGLAARYRTAVTRALWLAQTGKYREALDLGERLIADCESAGLGNLGDIQRLNMAQVRYCMGQYTLALHTLDQLRHKSERSGRTRLQIMAELSSADCLLLLGRHEEALELSSRLFDDLESRGDLRSSAQACYNSALSYAGLGRHAEAMEELERAGQRFVELDDRYWSAAVDWVAASVALAAGDLDTALGLSHRSAVAFSTTESSTSLEAFQARSLHARILVRAGRYREAKETIHLLASQAHHQEPIWQYPVASGRAELALAQGNSTSAIKHLHEAIDWLERIQSHVAIELRADYLSDKLDCYREIVSLLLTEGDSAQAFDYASRARSRGLRSAIQLQVPPRIQPLAEEDRPIAVEVESLLEKRDQLVYALRHDALPATDESLDEQRRPLTQQLADVEAGIRNTWRALVVRNGAYERQADLWQIAQGESAATGIEYEVVLEYFDSGNRLVAFVLTSEGIVHVQLEANRISVQRLLARLESNRRMLRTLQQEARAESLLQHANTILARLYDLLIRPLIPVLPQGIALAIVPCGALHRVPFAALHDGRRYLVQERVITVLPSARMLRYAVADIGRPSRVVAVGFDCGGQLPRAEAEARDVARCWSGTALLGTEATKGRVRDALESADIVHLATHAILHPREPMLSSVELADGWLTAVEISELLIRAPLVVLSACHTGAAHHHAVDEVQGLERALISAGAGSIVSSIGPESDQSTASLLTQFHAELREQACAALALQSAMVAASASSETAYNRHPAQWAGFKVFGRYSRK